MHRDFEHQPQKRADECQQYEEKRIIFIYSWIFITQTGGHFELKSIHHRAPYLFMGKLADPDILSM
ncbi:hypothetical protein T01_7698 [Trichinella spiralis]|uniref:Uncharacterized protein n=1 Tax=Trichinella spiralis TaxID=6334 RepID=A0A0V1BNW1_TRISP|nr:hypothetical protein T01_7698 [Trichinella spiralis]